MMPLLWTLNSEACMCISFLALFLSLAINAKTSNAANTTWRFCGGRFVIVPKAVAWNSRPKKRDAGLFANPKSSSGVPEESE